MKKDPSLWYIQGLKLDGRISAELGDELRTIGMLERWGHRASITRRADSVGIILSGALDVNDGHHVKSPRLKPGDILGFSEQPRADELVRAFDETTICSVERNAFDELMRDKLGSFWVFVGVKNRGELSVPVSELIYRPADVRLARTLDLLGEQHGEISDGGIFIPTPLRSRHLSGLTGILNSRLRRILNQFEEADLVRVGRKGVLLPNPGQIAAYGQRHEE